MGSGEWRNILGPRIGVGVLLAVVLGGCVGSTPSGLGVIPDVVDRQPQPGDRRVSIDGISLSDDKRTAIISFTGGRHFDPADPCSTDYVATAEVRDDILEVAVIETVSSGELLADAPDLNGVPIACDAAGHFWTLEVELAEPFHGSTVHDISGQVRFVSAPDGLIELAGLPDGWTLRYQNDVGGLPTGRWQRQYAPSGARLGEGTHGVLDFYQAFGGPVSVSGGDEQRSVSVGAGTGTLFRQPTAGELVLVWDLDGTGLALVANEADIPEAALIELAESAFLPDS